MTVRTTLLALALGLAACGRDDKPKASATPSAPVAAMRGPDHLMLRVSRTGGEARVYAYPRLDTVVWSTSSAPAPERVLAFDDEAGTIAYVDTKGAPALMDFRQGTASRVTKVPLTGLQSWDGSNIYGIAADGSVERYGPSGPWKWKARLPARALFPQPDASVLVLAQHLDGSVVWRLRPPTTKIVDSVELSKVNRTLRTQIGDRLYLVSGRELTGMRTRTMQRAPSITFSDDVELLEATPSGDRVFAVVKGSTTVEVVDRFHETISGRIDIGRHIADMRIDPLGRYLLAHPEGVDSALVVALGTNRVIGAVETSWREDLPFVAPDGGVALAQGTDVVVVDGETLKSKVRVKGGASDFWYAFRWTGFRPRDSRLDRPVEFGGPALDSARPARDTAAPHDSSAPAAPVVRDTASRRSSGYTVSFAALLLPDKARELAGQIKVGNESARVVTAMRDGAAIYRVVMGPYATKEDAERIGKESKQSYWVYEGGP
ncbi:MAG: Sporulation protein [Gemmatimonadetes bacterium]|nr:Sporulation protein [Gemmatimonadota bacterium]